MIPTGSRIRIMRFSPGLIIALLSFVSPLLAQESPLQWEKTQHDFGVLHVGDTAKVSFVFTNGSKRPVKLYKVAASCGCTTPDWTRETIAPGKQGKVDATYDTQRIGEFEKTIRVWPDSGAEPEMLTIKGSVLPTTKSFVVSDRNDPQYLNAMRYRYQHGLLYLEHEGMNIGDVTSANIQSVDFPIANFGDRAVRLSVPPSTDPSVIIATPVEVLKPGEETLIKVIVDGKKCTDTTGVFTRQARIRTDMPGRDAEITFTVTGNFRRIYTNQQFLESPRLTFPYKQLDGGKIPEGEFFEHSFPFTNTGRTDLIILSAKADCGCTAVTPPVKTIPPGQTSTLRVVFDSRGRSGINTKQVTIKSNDLFEPTQVIQFTVDVVSDPFHASPQPGKE